jgi:hypothetical protein
MNMTNWIPKLITFSKTQESYFYPSSSQQERHVPTSYKMTDGFISHDIIRYEYS